MRPFLPGPWAVALASVIAGAAACGSDVELFSTAGSASTGAGATTGAGTGGGGGGPVSAGSTTSAQGGAGPSSTSASSSGAGGEAPCTFAEDCVALSDACNTGACINGGCAKTPANQGGPCDDGTQCTTPDVCQNGQCTGLGEKPCPSSGPCTIGYCDPAVDGCVQVPGNDGASCVDGDPCTITGICSAGVCSPGQPVDCSFLDGVCSTGACDPQLGCVALPKANGSACDDQLFCTTGDVCSGGVCAGTPTSCAPPGDPCKIGSCNEATNTCTAVPGNDGAACSGGNPCAIGVCSAGACAQMGPANQGAPCDDGDGCTGGTTCQNGSCTAATSVIVACNSGDACCPAGCSINGDGDCLYWQAGVQQNVAPAALTGWSQCWSGVYSGNGPSLGQILAQCDKQKLLMACRPVGAPTFTLAAMAPRADVLFDCGQAENCTKQSNGVGWYFDEAWSWGFAPGGLAVKRFSCDFDDGSLGSPELRLCWHTGGGSINAGYRCGDNDLNGASGWERVVYEAD